MRGEISDASMPAYHVITSSTLGLASRHDEFEDVARVFGNAALSRRKDDVTVRNMMVP
jgi:hypothetical protein